MSNETLAPESNADMSASHTARLGLLADLHLTPDTADEIATQVRNAIQHFESSNVDRIVVLGDLILEADTTADTNARLEQVFDLFEKTDLPVTHLLGNHDVVETDWQDVLDFTGIDPRHGAFPLTDDITGISLDTSAPEYPDARGKLSEAELEYLDQELEAAEYAVVFTHHPLYYHDLSDDGHFDEHPEAAFASDKYLANELFAEHGNVIAAVNGHTHLSDHTIYQGVPYFTINAMNEESPGNLEPNGSFAVLEVSRSRLKRLSHRHGTFDSAETIDYPADDQTVALGGTFGPIHDGHRQMFQRAFELGDVMVGLTSDELSSKTRHTDRPVPSFEERKATLQQELDELAEMYDREYTTRELTDPMGPVADDPTYTHLIVSPETFSRGETVNEKRLENGLEPMTLEVVEPLLADDGQRISSTRIVNGEIDEHGNVLDD